MRCNKLTVLLYRLFDQISLLRNQGSRAGSEGDTCFATVASERLVWSAISRWTMRGELRLVFDGRILLA